MIFPKEIIENSALAFNYKHQVRSKSIYLLIIVCLVGGFSALPFIKTDIYFTSRGIIKPQGEKTPLISPNTGYVAKSNILYNALIAVGDTLLVIDNARVLEEIEEVKLKLELAESNISDLNYLLFSKNPIGDHLDLPVNRSNLIKHDQQIRQVNHELLSKKTALERQEILFDEKVITTAQIEDLRFDYQRIVEQKALLIEDQKFNWQTQRKEEQLNIMNLKSQLKSLSRNKDEFVLIAQVSGLLVNVKELTPGTLINSGERLAEVSPDKELIVEALIPPSKIGLINQENTISYQIDAFNYRNWGLATGKILEISKDVELINDQPVFRALASIDQSHLQLKDGIKGELKRGLTLSARFKITERTLYDLLYDKIDDWLNPSQNSTSNLK